MLEHTRPADLDDDAGGDPWADFRVQHAHEKLRLLRAVRDAGTPVMLNAPCGSAVTVTLWTVDAEQQRINFSADAEAPALARVVDADEAVAVTYLDSVKLQFDLNGLVLVRGTGGAALQCAAPREIYRFQRRQSYRVRPQERHAPLARLRHPALPEMQLALRVLDVSIGGCALWLPHDVPPLQPGSKLGGVEVALDGDTRFQAALLLQHVSGGSDGGGARLGCEWHALPQGAERALQRWIDRTQQRRRLLSLE